MSHINGAAGSLPASRSVNSSEEDSSYVLLQRNLVFDNLCVRFGRGVLLSTVARGALSGSLVLDRLSPWFRVANDGRRRVICVGDLRGGRVKFSIGFDSSTVVFVDVSISEYSQRVVFGGDLYEIPLHVLERLVTTSFIVCAPEWVPYGSVPVQITPVDQAFGVSKVSSDVHLKQQWSRDNARRLRNGEERLPRPPTTAEIMARANLAGTSGHVVEREVRRAAETRTRLHDAKVKRLQYRIQARRRKAACDSLAEGVGKVTIERPTKLQWKNDSWIHTVYFVPPLLNDKGVEIGVPPQYYWYSPRLTGKPNGSVRLIPDLSLHFKTEEDIDRAEAEFYAQNPVEGPHTQEETRFIDSVNAVRSGAYTPRDMFNVTHFRIDESQPGPIPIFDPDRHAPPMSTSFSSDVLRRVGPRVLEDGLNELLSWGMYLYTLYPALRGNMMRKAGAVVMIVEKMFGIKIRIASAAKKLLEIIPEFAKFAYSKVISARGEPIGEATGTGGLDNVDVNELPLYRHGISLLSRAVYGLAANHFSFFSPETAKWLEQLPVCISFGSFIMDFVAFAHKIWGGWEIYTQTGDWQDIFTADGATAWYIRAVNYPAETRSSVPMKDIITVINEVKALVSEGNRIIMLRGVEAKCASTLRAVIKSLGDFATEYRAQYSAMRPRPEPFSIIIEGGTSVGKTTTAFEVVALIQELYDPSVLSLPSDKREQMIYVKPTGSKFMDGLNEHHRDMIVDDIYSINEVCVAEENYALFDMISSINIMPSTVNVADVDRKGALTKNFRCVVATTNDSRPDLNTLRNPFAVLRRWKVEVKQCIRPEFQDSGDSGRLSPNIRKPGPLPEGVSFADVRMFQINLTLAKGYSVDWVPYKEELWDLSDQGKKYCSHKRFMGLLAELIRDHIVASNATVESIHAVFSRPMTRDAIDAAHGTGGFYTAISALPTIGVLGVMALFSTARMLSWRPMNRMPTGLLSMAGNVYAEAAKDVAADYILEVLGHLPTRLRQHASSAAMHIRQRVMENADPGFVSLLGISAALATVVIGYSLYNCYSEEEDADGCVKKEFTFRERKVEIDIPEKPPFPIPVSESDRPVYVPAVSAFPLGQATTPAKLTKLLTNQSVLLDIREAGDGQTYNGSGTLIEGQYVLTAAHVFPSSFVEQPVGGPVAVLVEVRQRSGLWSSAVVTLHRENVWIAPDGSDLLAFRVVSGSWTGSSLLPYCVEYVHDGILPAQLTLRLKTEFSGPVERYEAVTRFAAGNRKYVPALCVRGYCPSHGESGTIVTSEDKIVGVLSSGNRLGNLFGVTPFTKVALSSLLAYLKEETFLPHISPGDFTALPIEDSAEPCRGLAHHLSSSRVHFLGSSKTQGGIPNKTELVVSPAAQYLGKVEFEHGSPFGVTTGGDFWTLPTFGPRVLRDLSEGKYHYLNPILTALADIGDPSRVEPSERFVFRAFSDYLSRIMPLPNNPSKPLLELEIINGRGSFIPKMNLNTSCGFGWVGSKRVHCESFVNERREVQWRLLPKTRDRILAYERLFESGRVGPAVATLFIKDEVLKFAKSAAAKERIPFCFTFEFLYLSKKYLGPLMEFLMQHPMATECMCGVNAMGPAWKKIRKALKLCLGVFQGDFRKFDKSHLRTLLLAFARFCYFVMLLKLGYSEDDAFRGLRLIIMAIHAVVVAPSGEWFEFLACLLSGWLLTTIANSFVVSILLRIAYYSECEKRHIRPGDSNFFEFSKAVILITMGDDNSGGPFREECLWFNFFVIRDHLAPYGIDYTPATKEGPAEAFSSEAEWQFLKRGFAMQYFDGEEYVLCPLVEGSLLKMLSFSRVTPQMNAFQNLSVNVFDAHKQYFFHGERVFKTKRAFLQRLCYLVGIKFRIWASPDDDDPCTFLPWDVMVENYLKGRVQIQFA